LLLLKRPMPLQGWTWKAELCFLPQAARPPPNRDWFTAIAPIGRRPSSPSPETMTTPIHRPVPLLCAPPPSCIPATPPW
jgi:hypothetical protein